MKTRKILAAALMAAMLLALPACGGNAEKEKNQPDGAMTEQPTEDTSKATRPESTGKNLTYDFSSPEEDLENAPGFRYYIQTIPVEETEITNSLSKPFGEGYYDALMDVISGTTLFEAAQIIEAGDDTESGSDDKMFYATTPDAKHEIDVAVYAADGYAYLTYGTIQPVTDFASWEADMDASDVPALMKEVTGMALTMDDIREMVDGAIAMESDAGENGLRMVSITDPMSYDSMQVALLENTESKTVAVTGSRYIEFGENSDSVNAAD